MGLYAFEITRKKFTNSPELRHLYVFDQEEQILNNYVEFYYCVTAENLLLCAQNEQESLFGFAKNRRFNSRLGVEIHEE